MNKGEGKVFNFGPFRLDVSNRLLFCENEQLHLTNHEFIILLALVENNQQFISHNELMEKIWPGLQPPLSSLYAIIAKLRKILGSDGKSYIESKIWYGYRFAVPVTITRMSDDQLLSSGTEIEGPAESANVLRVFLSHCSADKPKVRDLYHRLAKDGFRPWLDEEDLLPGQDWRREIPKAVRSSQVVLVCLSMEFNNAGYRQKEVRLALEVAEQQLEGVIFVIPVKLEECEIPDELKQWQWANLSQKDGYEKLLRALKARESTLHL